MDYQVILGPLALADLDQIVRYIAPRDPVAAGRLGTRLPDQAKTLCRLPHRGGPACANSCSGPGSSSQFVGQVLRR